MDNIFENNIEVIKDSLEVIWNYMKLDQPLEKCDVIIGCGCTNLEIPKKCAELLKDGYAPLIVFTGGQGKMSNKYFSKAEAEIFKEIALENGVPEDKIILETKATNTGDNLRFSMKLLNEKNIKYDKVLIVGNTIYERRIFLAAKKIMEGKQIIIASPNSNSTFDEYFNKIKNEPSEKRFDNISVIVGNIQRLIIFPQFGWELPEIVPDSVLEAYNKLKLLGFSKFVMNKEQIDNLIGEYGLEEGQVANYFK